MEKAETPTANPPAGEVTSGTEVELTSGTGGAKIYYTLDSGEPSDSSNLYSSKISITGPTTIKAIAYADGHDPSEVLTAAYTIKADD